MSLVSGLVILVLAADKLVDGAVALSRRFGMSTLVVGMTVVAYGTSFPEFIVSTMAAVRGVGEFALGNIVGSNIANIGLVLGAVALAKPIPVSAGWLFRRDLPLLAIATAIAIWFLTDDLVARWEGMALLAIAAITTGWCVLSERSANDASDEPRPDDLLSWTKSVAFVLIGLVGLLGGAHFMVDGASDIARALGISERVIGLTIVALGTSLPELAASVAGATKGHPELAIGNVVGSCIFNLAFVLGGAVVIRPMPIDFGSMVGDVAVMATLTVVMIAMMSTKRRVSRGEGGLLVVAYVGYLGWLAYETIGGS